MKSCSTVAPIYIAGEALGMHVCRPLLFAAVAIAIVSTLEAET